MGIAAVVGPMVKNMARASAWVGLALLSMNINIITKIYLLFGLPKNVLRTI